MSLPVVFIYGTKLILTLCIHYQVITLKAIKISLFIYKTVFT